MRKTEARLPQGLQASDLGQAVTAADGRCSLVSFASTPVVAGRENTYVLFATDPALASVAQKFEWTFTENGAVANIETRESAEAPYRPSSLGTLSIKVRVLDAGDAEQASIALEQEAVLPSAEVEALIAGAQNQPGPGASDPEALRELVNQHCRYYQDAALRTPETGDGFTRFLFIMASDGAAKRSADERRRHTEALATALDAQPDEFARLAAVGVGVCGVRLALLAMAPPAGAPLLAWSELPEPDHKRAVADEELRERLAALSEDARIDLFNIARFPKSNIVACGRILESLRDRYFPGANFNDVLTGMSGTRAHWIARHYTEGPISRT